MVILQYHPAIAERFPAFVGGVIVGDGLANAPASPELLTFYEAEQKRVLGSIDEGSLSQIDALAAWRSAFRKFGVEPTKYRCASEALIRRLTKKGDIPSINTLVDIGNILSIRYALPIAVIDRSAVQGTITVRFAEGNEQFVTIGSDASDPIPAGEVIFIDEGQTVMARRWCWRQSFASAAVETTNRVVITVESQHEGGRADVEKAINEMIPLLKKFAGGSYSYAILDANKVAYAE